MDPDRRDLLNQLVTASLAAGAGASAPALAAQPAAALAEGEVQPGPAMTRGPVVQRTPGRPGDFDFLTGRWHIRNHRRRDGGWDHFDGEASCVGLLDGVCSVEELRIPAREFSGIGLRLLDRQRQVWSDHWVNARSGVVGVPGLEGSFEDGAGIFASEEMVEGRRVLYRSVWDLITPQSCRWQQGSSRDEGRSWQVDWSMDWRRIG